MVIYIHFKHLYYLCSENKGADQLRGHREADLSLFSHMQNAGFLLRRLIYENVQNAMFFVEVASQPRDRRVSLWGLRALIINTFLNM